VYITPTPGGPAEELVRARVVYAHDDLLPYRPVVLHLGVLPFVPDAVRVRVVFDHGGGVQTAVRGGSRTDAISTYYFYRLTRHVVVVVAKAISSSSDSGGLDGERATVDSRGTGENGLGRGGGGGGDR